MRGRELLTSHARAAQPRQNRLERSLGAPDDTELGSLTAQISTPCREMCNACRGCRHGNLLPGLHRLHEPAARGDDAQAVAKREHTGEAGRNVLANAVPMSLAGWMPMKATTAQLHSSPKQCRLSIFRTSEQPLRFVPYPRRREKQPTDIAPRALAERCAHRSTVWKSAQAVELMGQTFMLEAWPRNMTESRIPFASRNLLPMFDIRKIGSRAFSGQIMAQLNGISAWPTRKV